MDTYKPEVAEQALDAGAVIVNNIMGTKLTKRLVKTLISYNGAIVLMHIRGIPRTMQKNIRYQNLIKEINSALKKSVDLCLDCGMKPNQIVLDPGIGFGKTVEHNLQIIKHLNTFGKLGYPLLMGTSRKSFIGAVLDKEVDHRLSGSLATVSASIMNGAHIVRVHDIKETKDVTTMTDAIVNA